MSNSTLSVKILFISVFLVMCYMIYQVWDIIIILIAAIIVFCIAVNKNIKEMETERYKEKNK